MSPASIQAMVDAATFVLSVGVSAFISGTRWGEVRGDVKSINERLAKIEGMFTLRLRDKDQL